MYSCYSFLTSALDGGEWSASRPGHALPPGKDPRYPLTGGWVGIRAGLDTEDTGKVLCLCRGLNPGPPVCSQTLYVIRCVRFYNRFGGNTVKGLRTLGDNIYDCVYATLNFPVILEG
jgi:hypothetical protein